MALAPLTLLLLAGLALVALAAAAPADAAKLQGKALSGKKKLSGKRVALYRAGRGDAKPKRLAAARTRGNGSFELRYDAPGAKRALLYVLIGARNSNGLAAVLGPGSFPGKIVVNELTTAALGYAAAQFVSSWRLGGDSPGLQNAARMAKNVANVRNGRLGKVLRRPPNGTDTQTIETVNSIANMLPRCARTGRCNPLFRTAKLAGERRPKGVLAAVATIARNPWNHVGRLFKLSQQTPNPYRPALGEGERPDGWTVALRFDGDGMSINGPGAFAIDEKGNVWVNNNYTYDADPLVPVCAGQEMFKFKPNGKFAKGSPFSGGGLSGAGFGITLAPDGDLWIGNFGFKGVGCTEPPPPANSVSEFKSDGTPVSGDAGYTAGPIDAPQATVSDRDGNIWIANCGNGTVTIYPDGDPSKAFQSESLGIASPFGLAINAEGQAFVGGNGNNKVAIVNPDGTPAANSPVSGGGIDHPLGVAVDSRGKIWVSNSGVIPIPCETPVPPFDLGGSLTLLDGDGSVVEGSPFSGGGTIVPWGIAVDGNDNVWVGNFGGQALGNVCGTRPKFCPKGVDTGDPIAPDTGYGFDGLFRVTGVAVDPSGNVWAANNWNQVPIQTNPGGQQIVTYLGLAAPLETPIFGPPER